MHLYPFVRLLIYHSLLLLCYRFTLSQDNRFHVSYKDGEILSHTEPEERDEEEGEMGKTSDDSEGVLIFHTSEHIVNKHYCVSFI